MDVKASARAKHASSQRGRARHSARKHQPQPQLQQQQQQQQSATHSQQPQNKKELHLPSNWSRYEEEEEEEDQRLSDVPPVKSKGANYRDLLAEKSLLQGPDLSSGRKRLMVTRGLDLWSRFTDLDNLWSTHKVSGDEDNFFTLDLDFLNEELAKIDIAERLLVDPKYIPLEERQKYESVRKNEGAKTAEDIKASLTTASRSTTENLGFTKSPVLVAPQEIDVLHGNTLAGHKDVREGVLDTTFLEKTGATPKLAPDKKLEVPDRNRHSVSKEPLVQLSNATNLFDAKSAEAELDALLDMLNSKSAGQSPSLVPNMSSDMGRSPVAAAKGSYHDALYAEKSPLNVSVQASDGATSNPNIGATSNPIVGASNETALPMESTKLAGNIGSAPSHAQVDPVKSVPNLNLDEDFDDWLDSL